MNIREQLTELASRRILILDGAMGTMVQRFKPTGADFRGQRFKDHSTELLGCNDLLCLTKPEIISSIHEAYLKAGADIIETCSLNSTAVSLADYGLADLAYEVSVAAAAVARKAADKFSTTDKPRFVAGSIGPTTRSGSMSPDMDDPGKRGVTWGELESAYYDNARGLLDGGADILLAETLYDTLNAKAAVFAINRLLEERHLDVPLILSATVSDAAGRLLSGQTVEAFWTSVAHAKLWAVGLNCSFGAEKLKAHIAALAGIAPCLISAYPNAGLPNRLGEYDETPETMAATIEEYMKEGLVNIVGGCCGSTPDHIAAIAARAVNYAPRVIPKPQRKTVLAGLEPFTVDREKGLTNIGERTNVAGSRKFLRLIKDGNYTEALIMVRDMIDQGAALINVGMDDPFLDAPAAMTQFLNLALSDPDIARVPVMVDSSRWELIETGLKLLQGKGLVNSISLKEGEAEFLKKARIARRYGAAVVVMLFDERGQGAEYERKIEIAKRSYELLVRDGFPPEDIVFDPNVLSVATGIPEHDRYALDFIRACQWIREHCPESQISGGITNLSFSFRGNDTVREAMHAVFLKHAFEAGLSMAIVNPGALVPYDDVEPGLRDVIEDLLLCKSPDAAERLLTLAIAIKDAGDGSGAGNTAKTNTASWRSLNVEERVVHALVKGMDDHIEGDVLELRGKLRTRALELVEGPLMRGMREVSRLFGEGKMFLPQVIRSARVMKKAVSVLEPFIEQEKTAGTSSGGTILLATVKGDVHDIGKNIVGVVLGCNGYTVKDLGIMVPAEDILDAAEKEGAGVIGLSGLITPSLEEMVRTAREMEKRRMTIPLLIGGATTSLAHTALRIAPEYSGPVVYVSDAGQSAGVVRSLLSANERPRFMEELEGRYRQAVEQHEKIAAKIELIPLEAARKNSVPKSSAPNREPKTKGLIDVNGYPLERIIPYIDWEGFLRIWSVDGHGSLSVEKNIAREKLLEDARKLLAKVSAEKLLELRGVLGIFPACSKGEDILVYDHSSKPSTKTERARFAFLRNQEKKRARGPNPCLADFLPEADTGSNNSSGWLGLFALSASVGLEEAATAFRSRNDDYGALLLGTLADSLAEAFAEEIHLRIRREWWGYAGEETLSIADVLAGKYTGIRPAFGYPPCPDHQDKRIAFDLLDTQKRCGLTLTESAMMIPAASVCGMVFSDPGAYYFSATPVGDDQLEGWAARKGISAEEARRRLGRI
ncbi:methionine synthase [Treponema primitia]|uniref:methionine synthase n=1 Tax=Treponema primitia TaxID=88058 RepID=UPI0002554C2C|nr:methionine synthase [Treponema primitia]